MKTACLILAAGEGKRMRSGLAKVMHPVCGVPMIYYPTALAIARGYDPVVVVTSPQHEDVRAFLSAQFGDGVCFATQDPPLGTGHAVISARGKLRSHKGKLLIIYGDVPLLATRDLQALERAGKDAALAFITAKLSDPSGYGRVVRDERGGVQRIVEHRDASAAEKRITEINAGLYIVESPRVFEQLQRLKKTNAQGEYYLTDLVERSLAEGSRVRAVEREGARALLGVNDRRQLAEAGAEMNRRLCERLMYAGVTLVDPATTRVGPFVKIGRDSIIEPGCHLSGQVRIGTGCRLGPGVVISDSVIKKGAEIRAYSVLDSCQVGPAARVGPFSRLRPEARLDSGAQVGNFVEMKKSVLGKGAKANHLT